MKGWVNENEIWLRGSGWKKGCSRESFRMWGVSGRGGFGGMIGLML